MPVAVAPAPSPQATSEQPPITPAEGLRQRPCKVLIIEDEVLLALQLELLLAGAGFQVVGMSADADEAVRLADETRPDLVIADVRLGGERDGIEAAIAIRKRLGIRALFVTANGDLARAPRAAAADPLGVLEKPYSERELMAALHQAVHALPAAG